jgi:signal transduction histidine kinase
MTLPTRMLARTWLPGLAAALAPLAAAALFPSLLVTPVGWLVLGTSAAAASLIAAALLAKRLTTDVERVSDDIESASRRGFRNYVRRSDWGMLGDLAAAFDWLLQEVQGHLAAAERKSQDEAKADKEMEDFFHAVAHDLRAPLFGIQGYVRLLEKSAPLSAKDKGYVAAVYQSCDRLSRLITDILDIGRLDGSRADFQREKVRLQPLLEKVREELGGWRSWATSGSCSAPSRTWWRTASSSRREGARSPWRPRRKTAARA